MGLFSFSRCNNNDIIIADLNKNLIKGLDDNTSVNVNRSFSKRKYLNSNTGNFYLFIFLKILIK